eukprot:CAMPEP_0119038068 /NCGR_PEP_ID=MMETSP1177-20130426/6755_1 /TAXON_ID=2985 /ORGANISM="Ochromonas sp, Strain CCMP1899" /LENGTH=689 /DNA_ID=CAMNT_0007000155 /DNA_START=234 /DNA_END=2303 /DNA_ORIENTATION=-
MSTVDRESVVAKLPLPNSLTHPPPTLPAQYSLSNPSTLLSHDKQPTGKSPIKTETPRAGKSLEIDLMFELKLKAKRKNVYTAAVTLDNRINYKPKNIKKSPEQIKFIGDALDLNFVFASLEKSEKEILTSAMEKVRVEHGEDLIIQGQEGDFFYIIEKGRFLVLVNSQHVGSLEEGRSFGELALLYNNPRAATIRALEPCVVYALDRDTFRNTLANSSFSKNVMIQEALCKVPLLEGLTDDQMAKISDSVEMLPFLAGEEIIRKDTEENVFYMIKEGTVRVTDVGDRKTYPDHNLGCGEYFGERALIRDEPRCANVTAVTAVVLLALGREDFHSLLGPLREVLDINLAARGSIQVQRQASECLMLDRTFHIDDFSRLALLGSGSFGRVFLVVDVKTKETYALKTMLRSQIVAQKQQKNVLNEKMVMMRCNHPFILRLFGTFKDERKLFMLLEFVQGGELFAVIHTGRRKGLPNDQGVFYAAGIFLALKYLHFKDIAYRDLKPENCLIAKDGYPKMIDFGFAKPVALGIKTYTLCGTPEYLAPELVLGRGGHDKAVDYWAFGVLIFEMQVGYSPFCDHEGFDQVVICRNIVNGNLNFTKNFDPECKDLVSKLLVKEIQRRLGGQRGGVDDIKRHPWFANLDFDAYLQKRVSPPWIPKIKSATDHSHFDSHGIDDHIDNGPLDSGSWDRNF